MLDQYQNSTLPYPYPNPTPSSHSSLTDPTLPRKKLGRNDPPNLAETTRTETTQIRNDSGPKRLRAVPEGGQQVFVVSQSSSVS